MKELDLNKLLEYYNGFSFETGDSLIWNNCSIDQSKELANNEITHRSETYQKDSEVESKTKELYRLFFDLNSTLRSPNDIYIVDSGVYSETNSFVYSLSYQSIMLYNERINSINSQLVKKLEEIERIWESDPDFLRYQSKYIGGKLPNQYLKGNIEINTWICTENLDFKVRISSHRLDLDYSKHIAVEASKYKKIIYPIYRDRGCGEICLNDFLYNLIATNQKNIKLIICWINDIPTEDMEIEESYILETKEKIESIKNKFFGNRFKFIVIYETLSLYSYRRLIDEI